MFLCASIWIISHFQNLLVNSSVFLKILFILTPFTFLHCAWIWCGLSRADGESVEHGRTYCFAAVWLFSICQRWPRAACAMWAVRDSLFTKLWPGTTALCSGTEMEFVWGMNLTLFLHDFSWHSLENIFFHFLQNKEGVMTLEAKKNTVCHTKYTQGHMCAREAIFHQELDFIFFLSFWDLF